MLKFIKTVSKAIGISARAFVALVGIAGITAALADYTMTQGAGTTFGSKIVTAIHYAQQLVCDAAAPATQCAAVDVSGNLSVKDAAVLAAVQAAIPSQSPAVPIGGTGICDGANGVTNPCTNAATVKTVSTPAAATDKALVVDQRPGGNTAASVASVKSSVPVVNGGNTYNTIAASQTAQVMTGGGGGATGDYLSHCVLQPTTTAAGTMTILDNATTVFTFTTGTLSNLAPISIPIGAVSVSGAWKVTTGANETATCFGKFT